jgi:hypothetical protein
VCLVVALVALALPSIVASAQRNTPAVQQPPSDAVSVAITRINNLQADAKQELRAGMQTLVEGNVSTSSLTVCVVVHPLSGDTWWTQNLPGPADQNGAVWQWKTVVLLGTKDLGLNELFEVVAFAENSPNYCVNGKTFKTQQFPRQIPRSRILTVKRDRT